MRVVCGMNSLSAEHAAARKVRRKTMQWPCLPIFPLHNVQLHKKKTLIKMCVWGGGGGGGGGVHPFLLVNSLHIVREGADLLWVCM